MKTARLLLPDTQLTQAGTEVPVPTDRLFFAVARDQRDCGQITVHRIKL